MAGKNPICISPNAARQPVDARACRFERWCARQRGAARWRQQWWWYVPSSTSTLEDSTRSAEVAYTTVPLMAAAVSSRAPYTTHFTQTFLCPIRPMCGAVCGLPSGLIATAWFADSAAVCAAPTCRAAVDAVSRHQRPKKLLAPNPLSPFALSLSLTPVSLSFLSSSGGGSTSQYAYVCIRRALLAANQCCSGRTCKTKKQFSLVFAFSPFFFLI